MTVLGDVKEISSVIRLVSLIAERSWSSGVMRWIWEGRRMKSDGDTQGSCRHRHAVKQQELNSSNLRRNLKNRAINIYQAGGTLCLNLYANDHTHLH